MLFAIVVVFIWYISVLPGRQCGALFYSLIASQWFQGFGFHFVHYLSWYLGTLVFWPKFWQESPFCVEVGAVEVVGSRMA